MCDSLKERERRYAIYAYYVAGFGIVCGIVLLIVFIIAVTSCSSPPEKYRDVNAWLEVEGVNDGLELVRGDLPKLEALMDAVCAALPSVGDTSRIRHYGRLGFPLDTMLSDADSGGTFQCNDRVTLFVRAATVLGYRARYCPLRRNSDGEGHMMAEVWLKDQLRWCTFGLMAEQYYLVDGEPAAAVTLSRIAGTWALGRGTLDAVTSSSGDSSFLSLAPYLCGIRPAEFNPYGDERRAMLYTPLEQTPMMITADSALVGCDGYQWYIWPQDERP